MRMRHAMVGALVVGALAACTLPPPPRPDRVKLSVAAPPGAPAYVGAREGDAPTRSALPPVAVLEVRYGVAYTVLPGVLLPLLLGEEPKRKLPRVGGGRVLGDWIVFDPRSPPTSLSLLGRPIGARFHVPGCAAAGCATDIAETWTDLDVDEIRLPWPSPAGGGRSLVVLETRPGGVRPEGSPLDLVAAEGGTWGVAAAPGWEIAHPEAPLPSFLRVDPKGWTRPRHPQGLRVGTFADFSGLHLRRSAPDANVRREHASLLAIRLDGRAGPEVLWLRDVEGPNHEADLADAEGRVVSLVP